MSWLLESRVQCSDADSGAGRHVLSEAAGVTAVSADVSFMYRKG